MSESVAVELARWRATHILEYLDHYFADVFAGAKEEDLLDGKAGQVEAVVNAFRRYLHGDLADLVGEVTGFPEILRLTWRRIGGNLKDHPTTDSQRLGEVLDGLWALYEKTADFALGLSSGASRSSQAIPCRQRAGWKRRLPKSNASA